MLITREILGSEIMTKYIKDRLKDRLKDNISYQSTKYPTASYSVLMFETNIL